MTVEPMEGSLYDTRAPRAALLRPSLREAVTIFKRTGTQVGWLIVPKMATSCWRLAASALSSAMRFKASATAALSPWRRRIVGEVAPALAIADANSTGRLAIV